MRIGPRVLVVVCLIAGLAGFAATSTSRGQAKAGPSPIQQTTPQTSSGTLKVSSRLTLVDITVTDSKGQPVHGLTQADFTVKEDGKPQPVKSFQEFGRGDAPSDKPAAAPAALKLPPNFYINFRHAPPTTTSVNILRRSAEQN